MKKQLEQVQQFHDAFGLHTQGVHSKRVASLTVELRRKLIAEEAKEVDEELQSPEYNIVNLAKELADLCYVIYGTVLAFGIKDEFEAVFNEVHNSNMSKLDKDGKPIYREDGKVLKGENYFKADIAKVLHEYKKNKRETEIKKQG